MPTTTTIHARLGSIRRGEALVIVDDSPVGIVVRRDGVWQAEQFVGACGEVDVVAGAHRRRDAVAAILERIA